MCSKSSAIPPIFSENWKYAFLFWNIQKLLRQISAKTIDRHKISDKYRHGKRQRQRHQLSTLAFPVNVRNKSASSEGKAPGGRTKNENIALRRNSKGTERLRSNFVSLSASSGYNFLSSKFECNFFNNQLVWWPLWVFCRKPTFSAARTVTFPTRGETDKYVQEKVLSDERNTAYATTTDDIQRFWLDCKECNWYKSKETINSEARLSI